MANEIFLEVVLDLLSYLLESKSECSLLSIKKWIICFRESLKARAPRHTMTKCGFWQGHLLEDVESCDQLLQEKKISQVFLKQYITSFV